MHNQSLYLDALFVHAPFACMMKSNAIANPLFCIFLKKQEFAMCAKFKSSM